MHNFSLFLTKNECYIAEIDNYAVSHLKLDSRKARHSMIIVKRNAMHRLGKIIKKKGRHNGSLILRHQVHASSISTACFTYLLHQFTRHLA